MLVLLHPVHAADPVAVGSVVWPAGHGVHVEMEVAWTTPENLPATQLAHFLVRPSLYFPATHEVHAAVQLGQAVRPLASLAAGSHRTQAEAEARLPVPAGHDWHAVLPLKLEKVPGVHATHPVPDTLVPGAHALHVVTAPPGEYCSGARHGVHTPRALLYWPRAHEAERVGGVCAINNMARMNNHMCLVGIILYSDSDPTFIQIIQISHMVYMVFQYKTPLQPPT